MRGISVPVFFDWERMSERMSWNGWVGGLREGGRELFLGWDVMKEKKKKTYSSPVCRESEVMSL